MATFTNTVAPINTAAAQFYTWARPIATFFATAGWLQQADTGQIVWPASIFNITDANGNGTTVTFTGTVTSGATPLRVGSVIKVSGTTNFGTVASPIVYVITGGNLTTTFTALSATSAHDAAIAANTGWGTVYVMVTITAVTGSGSVATYTYTNTDGILCAGQSIVIPSQGTTGFTNTGFNGTFTITSVTPTTFTCVNGTNASETKTVTATVATLPGALNSAEVTTTTFPPAAANFLYEIWKMGDGNGLPVYLKFEYGSNSNSGLAPGMRVSIGSGTDGAGNLTGGVSTATVNGVGSVIGSASTFPSYFSGSTNRITLALWITATTSTPRNFLNIERSHDSSGVDTTSYATLTWISIASNVFNTVTQQSITSTAVTTAETKIPCISKTSTATGSFGTSTLLCPAFPVVGAVGNPMINVLVGKSADWTDQTQFSFTLYNTTHNYIAFNQAGFGNAAGNITYDASVTAALFMRYE